MNRASNYHELIQEFEGCSDPGNENYWEDWDTILDKFWFLDGDVKYTLYQESDLFIVPDNLTEDERKELWGC
jgi:hypothetical protein